MDCPVCHQPVEGSPKFCARCGSKIEPVASAATAMAPATEAEPRFDPFIGQTLGGRYRILRLLGEGGMGAVYVGEQNIGDAVRKVAVKTLHAHLSKDPKILQRFERECGTVAQLQHPNTIQLYDFGKTDDGILYMVMEFVQGESLAAILEKAPVMDPARVLHILQQICDALGEAHELGIVHRDLKPDNIVLTERAKDWVKVLDFGIAKRSDAAEKAGPQLTQQGTVLGTPPYMSPEQFTGKPIDGRSDIYSIGVMAYEMLAGRLPFDAATPWEWATKHMTVPPAPLQTPPAGRPIPEAMIQAVMRALEKDPAARFATTKDLYEGLSAGQSQSMGAMAPAGAVFTPPPASLGPATPPPRGGTQLGTPAQGMPGVGSPPYGQPMAPVPYGGPPVGVTPGAMAAAPSAAPRRGRGGGGAVIALIVIVLLLGAGGVVFAFMHGSNPNPLSPIASGDAAQPTVAAGGAVDAAQADAGAAVADNTSNKDKTPGLIDTSLPPLPTGPIPPPSNSDHAAAHKPDASAPSTPTAPPAPSHSAAPAPTPSSSTTDPAECKKARQLQKTMERPGANPSQKDFAAFANLRKKCVAEGGHL